MRKLGASLPAQSTQHHQTQGAGTEQQQARGLGNTRDGRNIQRQVLPVREHPPGAVAEGQEVTTLRESGRRSRPSKELGAEKVKSAGRTLDIAIKGASSSRSADKPKSFRHGRGGAVPVLQEADRINGEVSTAVEVHYGWDRR